MHILVACEESQEVCKAFRAKGHNAYSCDILDCSGGHPEWHIKCDVTPLLDGFCSFTTCDGTDHIMLSKWDMIIAFPPCTHLATSGARWFAEKRANGKQKEGIEFFCKFLTANCNKIVIENPIGIISGDYISYWYPDLAIRYNLPRKYSQVIQPWMFGDNFRKSTCLWIKGIPLLVPEITKEPKLEWFIYEDEYGRQRRQPKWYVDALHLPPEQRAKVRSKTYPGVARAMSEQWG